MEASDLVDTREKILGDFILLLAEYVGHLDVGLMLSDDSDVVFNCESALGFLCEVS